MYFCSICTITRETKWRRSCLFWFYSTAIALYPEAVFLTSPYPRHRPDCLSLNPIALACLFLHSQAWEAAHTQKTTSQRRPVETGHPWEQVVTQYVWMERENQWKEGARWEKSTKWVAPVAVVVVARRRRGRGGGGAVGYATKQMNWTIGLISFTRTGLQHVCLFMRPHENDLISACSINEQMFWKEKKKTWEGLRSPFHSSRPARRIIQK